MQIDFDAATHTYTVDGQVWPNVSTILSPLTDFSYVNPDVLKRAQDFGTAAHRTIELAVKEDLDEGSLAEPLARVLQQFRLAMQARDWCAMGEEIRVAHPLHRYAGTLDLRCMDRSRNDLIVDIKTGAAPATVGAQTAAYAAAWQAMNNIKTAPQRWCLELTETSYRFHRLKDPTDWSLFLSALNCHYFKEKHHGN